MPLGSAKSTWSIKFDKDDNHLSYDRDLREAYERAPEWCFTGIIQYVDYHRGRSSVTIEFVDTAGHSYYMSLAEFMDLVHELKAGCLRGTWGFSKSGNNTHLVRVSE